MIYWKLKVDGGKILLELCEMKDLGIIEVECYLNYIKMFMRIPSKYSVLKVVSYLKGKAH